LNSCFWPQITQITQIKKPKKSNLLLARHALTRPDELCGLIIQGINEEIAVRLLPGTSAGTATIKKCFFNLRNLRNLRPSKKASIPLETQRKTVPQ
jgi:hypothetical protein